MIAIGKIAKSMDNARHISFMNFALNCQIPSWIIVEVLSPEEGCTSFHCVIFLCVVVFTVVVPSIKWAASCSR